MHRLSREQLRHILVGSLAVALLLPASLIDGGTLHTSAFAVRLCGCAVVLYWLWYRQGALRRELALVVLGGVALLASHTLLADESGIALQSLSTAMGCGSIFLAASVARLRHRLNLAYALAAVAMANALVALWQWSTGMPRPSGGFFNPNYFALLAVAVQLVLLHRFLNRANAPQMPGRWARLNGTLIGVLGSAVVASGSRSALVAMALGGAILAWPRLPQRKAVRWACIGLLFGLGAAAGWSRWQTDTDPYSYSRLYIWQESIEAALEHPTGAGLGAYQRVMAVHGVALPGAVTYPRTAEHAHNEFIEAWVELGWLGLLLSVSLAGYAIIVVLRSNAQRRPLHLALLLLLGIGSSLSGIFHVPLLALAAAAWLGGLVGETAASDRGERSAPEPGPAAAERPAQPTAGQRRWLPAALSGLAVLVVAPELGAHLAASRSVAARDHGQLQTAERYARWATAWAPWRGGHQLLLISLQHLRGSDLPSTLHRLMDMAAQHPTDPRPWSRAAMLIEQAASRAADPSPFLDDAATTRCAAADRRPHNALMRFDCALAHYHRGDRQQARRAAQRCLAIETHMGRGHQLLALIGHEDGNIAEVREHQIAAAEAARLAGNFDGYAHAVLSLSQDLQPSQATESPAYP